MRSKALWLLLAINVQSIVGDSLASLALILDAAEQGRPWWVTAVFLSQLIPPLLLAPFLGSAVDQRDARKVWIFGLALEGAAFVAAALSPSFWLTLGFVAVANVITVATGAAAFKLLPSIAGDVPIERANAAYATTSSLAFLAGPALAGTLYPLVGSGVLMAINAATFAVAALLGWYGIARRLDAVAVAGERKALLDGVRDGWRALTASPKLRPLVLIMAGVMLATSIEGVAGVFYLRAVTSDDMLYGLLLSAWAVGALPGSMIGGWRRASTLVLLVGGSALIGVALLVEGLVPSFWVIAAVFLVGGFGNGAHNVGVRNAVHTMVDPAAHGSAWAYYGMMANSCVALGYVLGTPNALLGARSLVITSGALGCLVVVAGVLWLWRRRTQGGQPQHQRAGDQSDGLVEKGALHPDELGDRPSQ